MTQTTQELNQTESSAFVKLPTDANDLLKDILNHRGWDMRNGQVSMVEAINEGLQTKDGSVVDIAVNAPVGTGKTLAYIVAALALGKRIVIATSTKSLQDQIVGDELPELADDLMKVYGYKLNYSVLKGMSNYPCVTAINRALNPATSGDDEEGLFDDLDFGDVDQHADVLNRFLKLSEEARKDPALVQKMILESEALLDGIPLSDRGKYSAGSRCFSKKKAYRTVEEIIDEEISPHNALLRAIQEPHVCLYRSAYANCINSQIVVVNTSLLVAEIRKGDMPGRETLDPMPSILSGAGVVVIDEAHHASRIVSDAYSQAIEFDALFKEIRLIGNRIKKDTKLPDNPYTDLLKDVEIIEEDMIDAIDNETTEVDLQQRLKRGFVQLKEMCLNASQVTRNEWSGKHDISKKTYATLTKFNDTFVTGNSPIANFAALVGTTNRDEVHVNHLEFKGGDDKQGLCIDSVPIDVSWFRSKITKETEPANFYLAGTPLSHPENPAAVVMSSGTITKGTAISIGVKAASFLNVESPFDSNKVRMFVPRNIAAPPQRDEWIQDATRIAIEAIRKVGGRTLMLTTSNGMVEEFTNMFRLALEDDGIQVMRQGDGSKRQLIAQFKEDERSVLVATMGFWEGVDVPGPALSQVIMDKLPFPAPSPVLSARKQFFKDRGEKDFIKVDVDIAAIMLAQGAGRVIRSVNDIGACLVLDHRMLTKTFYSKEVSALLPKDWWITEVKDDYMEWLKWVNPDTRKGEMPLPNPEVWRTIGRTGRTSGRSRGSRG